MCLARSLELPIKKSENAVCRKRKHHLHHSLTVIFINVAVKAGVCNYYSCEVTKDPFFCIVTYNQVKRIIVKKKCRAGTWFYASVVD